MTTNASIVVIQLRSRDITTGDIVPLPEQVFVPVDQTRPVWPWAKRLSRDLAAGNVWRTVLSTCHNGDHPHRAVPDDITVLQVTNNPPGLVSERHPLIVAVRALDLLDIQQPIGIPGVYTVCGIWDNDEPIPVGTFAGRHGELSPHHHEQFEQGV